jgi:hypothetical protein
MSGYTNAAIALALVGGAVFFLVAPAYHHGRKWHEKRLQSGKRSLEPWHLIASGLAGIIVFAVVAAAGVIWQFNRETALSPQDISKIVAPFQAQIDALKRQQSTSLLFDHPPPDPPQPIPPSRNRYLRVDAEALVPALRQMHDVLNESVRDSTTLESFFRFYNDRVRNRFPWQQPISVKEEAANIQDQLNKVLDFHAKVGSDLIEIVQKLGSSYQNDLFPFVQAAGPTATLTEPLVQYRRYLSLIEKLSDSDAPSAREIIREYNAKIVEGIRDQYKARASDMAQVDAKIREIQDSQR